METVHADLSKAYNPNTLQSNEPYNALEVNFHQDFAVQEKDSLMLLDTDLKVGVTSKVVKVLESGNAVVVVHAKDFFVLDPQDVAAERVPGREDSTVQLLPSDAVNEETASSALKDGTKVNYAALFALGAVMVAAFVGAMVAILA